MLELLGLAERRDAFPDALSVGRRQALLLSAALVRPARLLMLGEPEQRLDARAKERLAEVLCRVKQAGTAVLLISHDRELVERVADHARGPPGERGHSRLAAMSPASSLWSGHGTRPARRASANPVAGTCPSGR
ncbi:AAA family ATPase [Streptomyces sp. URMC 123]|uniref:AAA family ATPase n=1 Tax=Streptomyces sp. URMC 123 TaxID=3423403 RepID=UPI003F1D9B9F